MKTLNKYIFEKIRITSRNYIYDVADYLFYNIFPKNFSASDIKLTNKFVEKGKTFHCYRIVTDVDSDLAHEFTDLFKDYFQNNSEHFSEMYVSHEKDSDGTIKYIINFEKKNNKIVGITFMDKIYKLILDKL